MWQLDQHTLPPINMNILSLNINKNEQPDPKRPEHNSKKVKTI